MTEYLQAARELLVVSQSRPVEPAQQMKARDDGPGLAIGKSLMVKFSSQRAPVRPVLQGAQQNASLCEGRLPVPSTGEKHGCQLQISELLRCGGEPALLNLGHDLVTHIVTNAAA